MTTCIIFHSYSGVTRGIAERIRSACGGDLVEVRPLKNYNTITAYTTGCLRARNEVADPVEPGSIDVAAYDLLVIGTPVWAWKATPIVNGAIASLKGCSGKSAIVFATCGGQAGETLNILSRKLEAMGVKVAGTAELSRKDIAEGRKVEDLIALVKSARGSGA